ncbi:DUF2304 domain-containing protein [Streptomyces jumonjinensis]|uniref:DUF2304 domain-containing protein n=1 Tax=Streptomyces jumonjinensis TaxID=1945 RepID=UPI003796E9E5
MRLVLLTASTGLAILTGLTELLRRRRLREKYAALWLVTAAFVVALCLYPSGPDLVAGLLGVRSGISLVLFLSVVFLLSICMHLTWEASRLDDKTRILSEEIALIRLERETGGHSTSPLRSGPAVLVPSPDGRHGHDG